MGRDREKLILRVKSSSPKVGKTTHLQIRYRKISLILLASVINNSTKAEDFNKRRHIFKKGLKIKIMSSDYAFLGFLIL